MGPRRFRPISVPRRRPEGAANKTEILTKIPLVFVRHGFSVPIATLVGGVGIVTDAVPANTQVRFALFASLGPPGLARQRPFPAATMTMTSHAGKIRISGRR